MTDHIVARLTTKRAELARVALVTPQSINAVVHQLVGKGLLERRSHPGHGKVVVLRLSRRGRALLDTSTPAVRAVEQAALAGVGERDGQAVRRWLAGVPRHLA